MKFKRKKEEKVASYTTEQCKSCGTILKRNFKEGDYVFKNTDTCSSCKGQMSIAKIFGETIT